MDDPKKPSNDPTIWEAMGIAWDLLISIVVTATLFGLIGVYGDRWLGTKYVVKIASFALMIVVGYRVILIKGRKIAKRLNELSAPDRQTKAPQHEHPPTG